MGPTSDIFSPQAEAEIRAAVERAEAGTAGEIVPYVVAASDSYEGSLWKGAAFGALVASAIAALVVALGQPWWPPLVVWVAAPAVSGAAMGLLAAGAVPPLRRLLIGDDVLGRRVERRAAQAFIEEEVFRTADRTGILIFLSLFEHRVLVLGDEGINRRVAAEEWTGLCDRLAEGVRRGAAPAALVAAISECGKLLERRGLDVEPDDEDELSNELRSRER